MKRFLQRFAPLGATILILQILAFLTSYFLTLPAVNGWYSAIPKSSLTPPDWVFAPVWTILYVLLAIALWMLWRARGNPKSRLAMRLFLAQLVLNYAWSFVFFGMRLFAPAFWMVAAMVALTMGVMMCAWPVKRKIVWLLVPYLAWISFAAYLTWAVMILNP